MESEDFEKAKNAFGTSTYLIDADHKKAREMSFEKIGNLECLFHFENRKKRSVQNIFCNTCEILLCVTK